MELKPCMHCETGDTLRSVEDSHNMFHVECFNCRSRGPLCTTKAEAGRQWNARHTSPEVKALVDASKRAEVMMDTCAILGIGDWLRGQYREDWATIHTELQAAIVPFKEPSDD